MLASADTCQLCAGPLATSPIAPRSSYAATGSFRVDVCGRCGAGTTMPRPTPAQLTACYEATYGYGAHQLIETEKRYRSAHLLARAQLTRGRVLDVGCMFGFLLDEARARGLETWGVELSDEPAAAARAHGHRVTTGTLDQLVAAEPDLRFDAIFAQHVVEHLPDPAGFFATAAQLLVPGGRLVIGVPNFAARLRRVAPAAWGWYQVPVHLHHFTADALRRLIEGAGLAVDDQATCGGDTLMLALTAFHAIGRDTRGGERDPGAVTRLGLRVAGQLLRPYHRLGDDELVMIARRP